MLICVEGLGKAAIKLLNANDLGTDRKEIGIVT